MKQILIPVDFSQGSFNSCKYAIEIATKTEPVALWLFHVYADQTFYNPSYDPDNMISVPMISNEFLEEIKKISESNMEKLKKQITNYIIEKGYSNFTLNKFFVSGDPEWMVEDICEELNIDGIIMSTSGTGNKGPLEGSIALKIMGKTTAPVIAIPHSYTNFKFNNVLYSTKLDNISGDIKAIKTLLELFKHHNFTFYVVHFRKSDKDQAIMTELENAFEKERLNEKVRFMIVNSDDHNYTAINSVATRNNIDLIAFIAHKTNPLKLLFSRGIHKDDFLATGLPLIGLPHSED